MNDEKLTNGEMSIIRGGEGDTGRGNGEQE